MVLLVRGRRLVWWRYYEKCLDPPFSALSWSNCSSWFVWDFFFYLRHAWCILIFLPAHLNHGSTDSVQEEGSHHCLWQYSSHRIEPRRRWQNLRQGWWLHQMISNQHKHHMQRCLLLCCYDLIGPEYAHVSSTHQCVFMLWCVCVCVCLLLQCCDVVVALP